MRQKLLSLTGLCLTTMLLAGSGCPLIPSIEEKVVQLAAGASVILEFEADGIINDKGEKVVFDFGQELDLLDIIDDAGIDVEDVIEITLAGVSYRVTVPDPDPTRRIVDSSVTVGRLGDDPQAALVTAFSDDAGVAYDFRTAPLDAAGVAVVNSMLAEILADIQSNQNPTLAASATWSGRSEPASEDTDFTWELKVDITVVGEITVDAPE